VAVQLLCFSVFQPIFASFLVIRVRKAKEQLQKLRKKARSLSTFVAAKAVLESKVEVHVCMPPLLLFFTQASRC